MSVNNHPKIIEVNESNFQSEVVQRSHNVPVVVDFWAPWCGPCRMLGPILERLASEPDSNFVLAKVNSDQNPQLSFQYNVRGIPAVKGFRNGRVVDEFVGAQPEPMVRQFIQRLTAGFRRPEPARQQGANGHGAAARLRQGRELLKQGRGCEAQNELQNFPASPEREQAQRLLPVAQFLCQVSRGTAAAGHSDLDGLYRQAADAVRRRQYSAALYQLLAALRQDSSYGNGQPRKVMEGLFELIDDASLVQAYRQQLASM